MFFVHQKESEIFLACTTVLATAQLTLRHHHVLGTTTLFVSHPQLNRHRYVQIPLKGDETALCCAAIMLSANSLIGGFKLKVAL